MRVDTASHPTADTLASFGRGKLPDLQAEAVARHLNQCQDCTNKLAGLSADSFMGRLRNAQAGASRFGQSQLNPADPASLPTVELPPELAAFTQYTDVRELGRGGMGVVYLAMNRYLNRPEVIKFVHPEMLQHPEAAGRFLREMQSAARLDHPNVVKAHTVLPAGAGLAFVMEYVPGADLAKLVSVKGPQPVPNACYYARDAALGLQHAHEKGMVHRDIKPSNLILTRDGKKPVVKILDFGLAKEVSATDTGLTGTGNMLGTPDYMPPEQAINAASADIRADIYSLGCTLYCLLSGHPPFSAPSLLQLLLHHRDTPAQPLSELRPDVPAVLDAVVAKMMAKEPDDRFQTPAEVAQALAPFTQPQAKSTVAPPRPVAAQAFHSTVLNGGESVIERKPRPSTVRREKRRAKKNFPWVPLSVGFALFIAGTLALILSGIIKLQTPDGVLIVEVDEPAEVFVDGEKVNVTWADGKTATVSVKPGTRRVLVKKEGFTAEGESVVVSSGEKQVVKARLIPKQQVAAKTVIQPEPKSRSIERDKFVPLFNGKDTSGWTFNSSYGQNWQVVNGIMTNKGKGWIFTKNSGYKNFRLSGKMMFDAGYVGSIRLRTTSPRNTGDAVKSYLVQTSDIHVPFHTGSIKMDSLETGWESLQRVNSSTPRSGQWFDIDVVVVKNTITVKIDGRLVAEASDGEDLYRSGGIALAALDDGPSLHVKRLEICELP